MQGKFEECVPLFKKAITIWEKTGSPLLANGYNNLSAYLESAYEQKALLQKRVDLMRVDAETQLPSSCVVDYASAADKKAKPVRWLIVVMTAIVAVGAAFLGMLAWETLQRAQAPNA